MGKALLMIFVKNAVKGKVKTRLAAAVGDDKALEIYHTLLQHTQEVTFPLSQDKAVYYSDEIVEDNWSEKHYQKKVQQGNDLGARMYHAFQEAFDVGYEQVVIIGSDCLEISTSIIQKAFESLTNNDAVIGPSEDGGYYLLGLNAPNRALFENKSWSTDKVLEQTIHALEQQDKLYKILPLLNDVDTIEDWEKALKKKEYGLSRNH